MDTPGWTIRSPCQILPNQDAVHDHCQDDARDHAQQPRGKNEPRMSKLGARPQPDNAVQASNVPAHRAAALVHSTNCRLAFIVPFSWARLRRLALNQIPRPEGEICQL